MIERLARSSDGYFRWTIWYWSGAYDEKEKLQNELVIAAPKVEYTDKVLTSVSGIRMTPQLTVWTEKGRRFIHSLLNNHLQMQPEMLAEKHAFIV
jgi:phage antirepressor YoqD-like protein